MRKLLTSRWFIVSVAVLILAAVIILGALPGSPVNFGKISGGMGNLFAPVRNVVNKAFDDFDDYSSAVFDGMAIREENRQLKSEIAMLQYRLRQNEEAAIRYEELKDAFHIRDTFSNFEVYGASILSREADEWFSSIRIGAGEDTGLYYAEGLSYVIVDVNMNLVGRIINIGDYESNVLPVTHEGFAVSCKVNEVNSSTYILSGDSELKRQGLCKITGINSNNIPDVGSEIVTSGEGGLFPEGIPIGVVESVDTSNSMNIVAVLRPYSNMYDLQDLFILVPNEAPEVTEDGGESVED